MANPQKYTVYTFEEPVIVGGRVRGGSSGGAGGARGGGRVGAGDDGEEAAVPMQVPVPPVSCAAADTLATHAGEMRGPLAFGTGAIAFQRRGGRPSDGAGNRPALAQAGSSTLAGDARAAGPAGSSIAAMHIMEEAEAEEAPAAAAAMDEQQPIKKPANNRRNIRSKATASQD